MKGESSSGEDRSYSDSSYKINLNDFSPEEKKLHNLFMEQLCIESEIVERGWKSQQQDEKRYATINKEIRIVIGEMNQKNGVNFWKKALLNSPDFDDLIEDYDEPVLDFISDVNVYVVTSDEVCEKYPEFNENGLIVEFSFLENPYFTNNVLYRYFKVSFEYNIDDIIMNGPLPPVATSSVCSSINWKPDNKHPLKLALDLKNIKKNKKITDDIIKSASKPTFFDFFTEGDKEDDDYEADLECDFELSLTLLDDVLKRLLLYYKNLLKFSNFDNFEDESSVSDDELSEKDIARLNDILRKG